MSSTTKRSGRTPDKTAGHASEPDQTSQDVLSPSHPDGTVPLFDPAQESADSTLEMPEVQQHAVAAASAKKETATAAQSTGVTDAQGITFNPAIHESMPDGTPRLSPSGKLRRKRGGGGKGPRSSFVPPADAPAAPDQSAIESAAKIKATAEGMTNMTFLIATVIGGPDFRPIINDKENEREQFVSAYTGVCEAYGYSDMPPWMALAFVATAFTARRFINPEFTEFKERKAGWVTRFKIWWLNRSDDKRRRNMEQEAQELRKKHGVNKGTGAGDPNAGLHMLMAAPAAH